MQTQTTTLGRIVVPEHVPEGFTLFWTTIDFDGRLNDDAAKAIADVAQSTATLTTCNQVHGTTVVHAPRGAAWRECDACDALWSDARPSLLGIKVADCLPVSIIDAPHHVIANVHSGWRGAVRGVTQAALDAAPLDSSTALAWLGPSIRVCCFEVGEEVVDQLRAAYPDADAFVDRSRAKPHVDLAALTAAILQRRGFAPERIIDSGLCTRCPGSLFHSYRRDGGRGGRNLAVVAQS